MSQKTITIEKIFHSPIKKVWDAWTNPNQMRQWFSPEGMTTPEASNDLKVGGEQKIRMLGEHVDVTNKGQYKEITLFQKLVFTWQWQNDTVISEVTVQFHKLSENQTKIILTHVFPDEQSIGMHPQGWKSTFNKLEKFTKQL